MITITSPTPISGVQSYGPHQVEFHNGVATVDALPSSVADYMRENGYVVDAEPRLDIPIPSEPKPVRRRKKS